MTPHHQPVYDILGYCKVFAVAYHRVPGSATLRQVPIFNTAFVDRNKAYPYSGKRERERAARRAVQS